MPPASDSNALQASCQPPSPPLQPPKSMGTPIQSHAIAPSPPLKPIAQYACRDWGRFFFYCDAGPKNWAMGLDNKLKMFDFDAAYWVVDGVLCSKDRHCGCTLKDKEGARGSACENNRCTYEGIIDCSLCSGSGFVPEAVVADPRQAPCTFPGRRQGCIGKGGEPPPPSRAPSLCPATVSLAASAGFNGICNRQ